MNEQKDFEDCLDQTYLDELGVQCYGEQWAKVKAHNVKRLKGNDPRPLGVEKINLLIAGLSTLSKHTTNRKRLNMDDKMNNIMMELQAPFHPSHVIWLPKALESKQSMMPEVTRALATPFVDVKAYQNRLDQVCGFDWSMAYVPWSENIICHLTINGVTRSNVGTFSQADEMVEPKNYPVDHDHDRRIAELAFKGACAMFGLGRYLRNLDMWTEYNTVMGAFTENSKARLNGIIRQHFDRYTKDQSLSKGAWVTELGGGWDSSKQDLLSNINLSI